MRQNGPVAQGAGKRAGSRRAPKKRVRLDPSMLVHAGGVTFCVIAWGYLVSAAIDFGSAAREGRSIAWLFLLVACIGAACCLFAGLLLGARLLRALGLTGPHDAAHAGGHSGGHAGPAPHTYASTHSAGHSPTYPGTPPPATPTPTQEIPVTRPPGGRRAAR